MNFFFLLSLLFPVLGLAFDVKPWFRRPFEFEGDAAFILSHYPSIQNATSHYSSTDQLLRFDLGVAPTPSWDFQIETECERTRKNAWSYLSFGMQARRLWFDDILGDTVSLTTNFSFRAVAARFLRDPSCLYHGNINFEGGVALGKEYAPWESWTNRFYLYALLGIGNKGAPYFSGLFSLERNFCDRHQFEGKLSTLIGFGDHDSVHPRHFHGYASIQHRSLDLTVGYHYLFDIWGKINCLLTYRLYAHCCPEHFWSLEFSYCFPFCPF